MPLLAVVTVMCALAPAINTWLPVVPVFLAILVSLLLALHEWVNRLFVIALAHRSPELRVVRLLALGRHTW